MLHNRRQHDQDGPQRRPEQSGSNSRNHKPPASRSFRQVSSPFRGLADHRNQQLQGWNQRLPTGHRDFIQPTLQALHLVLETSGSARRVTLSIGGAPHDDVQPGHHLLLLCGLLRPPANAHAQELLPERGLGDNHAVLPHGLVVPHECALKVLNCALLGGVVEARQVNRKRRDLLAQFRSLAPGDTHRHERVLKGAHVPFQREP